MAVIFNMKLSKGISEIKAFHIWFYIGVFLILFSAGFSISPLSDDWYYVTAPNPDFKLADLLPTQTFWRPFDVLFGALMGKIPALFPYLNRAAVILGHVLSSVLLDVILRKINIHCTWRRFSVCLFLFSPATWAVTLSPDALNQAFSLLFGLVAIYVHLTKGGLYYLVPCFIALLWKESGISWFFAVPILDAFCTEKPWNDFRKDLSLIKRCFKEIIASLSVVLIYFILRFSLYGSISLGHSEGTYKIGIFSFSAIKNLILLFSSACTGVDSIGLFGRHRSYGLVVITIILSLVFLCGWVISLCNLIVKKAPIFPLLCLALYALDLALPLIILGSAGEMHAYPILCAMTVIFAFVFDRSNLSFRKLSIPIAALFLAFTISSVHKLVAIYDYSDRTQALTQSIQSQYDNPDETVLFIVLDNWEGYSVFEQSAIEGTSNGLSVRPQYQWANLTHCVHYVGDETEAQAYIRKNEGQYATIFVVRDETAQRVK